MPRQQMMAPVRVLAHPRIAKLKAKFFDRPGRRCKIASSQPFTTIPWLRATGSLPVSNVGSQCWAWFGLGSVADLISSGDDAAGTLGGITPVQRRRGDLLVAAARL